VAKSTKSALSRNRLANLRAQRTRRRLYLMVISIMVPFLPINILMFVYNVWSIRGLVPYDYNAIHTQNNPYPFNSVLLVTSDKLTFQLMNVPYIAILTAIPIFVFFGTTKDAMNDYRKILLFVGLGKPFPKLNEEYDPDRSARSDFSMSFGSSVFGSNSSKQ
jgi:pheromone a factor receptor